MTDPEYFYRMAREYFQFLESDYGFREHPINTEKCAFKYVCCLTDNKVWFLIEDGNYGHNADLSILRHDPNKIAPRNVGNISIELLLANRRGQGEDYYQSKVGRGEVTLTEKMAYLSEGLQHYGADLISGNFAAIPPQTYMLEHYDGEDDLRHPESILNPKERRLLGIFSTLEAAELAVEKLSSKPGFAENVHGFVVTCHSLDRPRWNAGFNRK